MAIQAHLAELEKKHRALEDEINEALNHPSTDDLKVLELKRRKLQLKDEITRLRQIVDLAAGPAPVLFLVDELLSGTNSHDRRVGAEAILRGLLDRNAIGIATTHDLALTEMAGPLGSRAANVHFEDELRDGKMSFDYQMRPGVVQKSNALALMRAVGLDV